MELKHFSHSLALIHSPYDRVSVADCRLLGHSSALQKSNFAISFPIPFPKEQQTSKIKFQFLLSIFSPVAAGNEAVSFIAS
jgi:hypothetical protein